jgi:outer membrane protein, adhesin transport system
MLNGAQTSTGQGRSASRLRQRGIPLVALVALSACMGNGMGQSGAEVSSRADHSQTGLGFFNGAPPADNGAAHASGALDPAMQDGTTSVLITNLLNRRSVLQPGPLATVADAVMAANTRAAEADLRAAKLRAEARSANWLPTLGPTITLDALGAVVTGLMVTQALWDNGARRAEREYARADVEVAAVALAQDSNDRVREALDLYLTAEAARERARVNAAGLEQMARFAYVMTERVNAGISDRADLQIVLQKQDQMRSDMSSDQEAAARAMAELQVMAALPVNGLGGLSQVTPPAPTAVALSVMKAEAEGNRAIASATAQRSGFLPGLVVGGNLADGIDGLGMTLGSPNGLSLGMGSAMEAIAVEQSAAATRVGQEREAADRTLASLQGRVASLRRQAAEAQTLAADAARNYALFAEQQRAGQRSVPETVGVFETKIRAERAASDLRFDIAMLEVRIAALLGVLVDGERI